MKNNFSIIYRCLHLLQFVRKIAIARSGLPEDHDCAIRLPSEDDKWQFGKTAIRSASHSLSTPTWSASYIKQNPARKMRRRISGMKRLA